MEAITREEKFMAKILGEDVGELTPITRTEKFLNEIAKSGGGGVSSWNDLKGTIPPEKLPEGYPYVGEEATKEIVFNGDITGKEAVVYSGSIYLVKLTDDVLSTPEEIAGTIVKLIQNGNAYDIEVTENSIMDEREEGIPIIHANEMVMFVLEDTTFGEIPISKGLWTMCIPNSQYIAKIKLPTPIQVEVVHELAPKFLPEGYPYTAIETVEAYNKDTYSQYFETYGCFIVNATNHAHHIPDKLSVTFDGVDYNDLQITLISALNMKMAGNLFFVNSMLGTSYPNTGEPFVVAVGEDGMTFLVTDTQEMKHNVKVTMLAPIVHKMSNEFLPIYVHKDSHYTFEEIKAATWEKTGTYSTIPFGEMENIWLNGGAFYLDIESEKGFTKRYSCVKSVYDPDNEVVLLDFDVEGKNITVMNKSVSTDAYD